MIQAQDLSFVSMLKFSSQSKATLKITNLHDQDDDHLQWNAGRGPDTSMGVQCQHIFFSMDMWIIIMWFNWYAITCSRIVLCTMIPTPHSHNIFAWTLPSLGQILTCRRCGCFSKFFLLIAFFLCFPSLLVASRNIWVRETSDMCTLHLPFPPQPRIPVANKDWFIIGIPFTKKTCYNPNYDCYWVGVGPQCAPNLHTWICYAGKSTLVEQSSMIFQFIRNYSKMTWLRNVDQPKKLEFFEMHVWFDGIAQPGRRHPPPPPQKKKYFEHWFL